MKIACLLYPTRDVKVNEDTSFWLLRALEKRGHEVSHFESSDLSSDGGRLSVRLTRSRLDPRRGYVDARRSRGCDLGSIDAVLVRKEPPFDSDYVHTLQLLSLAKERGLRVVNDPDAMLRYNEKTLLDLFPDLAPGMCWTRDVRHALDWVSGLKGGSVVIKPLDNRSGTGVVRARASDEALPSLMMTLMDGGRRWVVLQRYLAGAAQGDKRVLLAGEEVVGVFRRVPAAGDFRSNLSVGGSMVRAGLTPAETRLVQRVAPELTRRGLWLTGLDVVDERLVEINITSPSGLPEIAQLYGRDRSTWMAERLERYLLERGAGRG
ncbi:MAG: Glutathione synthetase [Candidatus Omnitrophica bacterium]|nr:Glutathione synthetase [Candidatus Omnitrophota bacterium]